MAVPFCIPTRNEGFYCSTSLPEFGILSVFDFGHSNMCVVVSHCSFKKGEGNGTPLQYSCLENPMDGGAW